MWEEGTDYTSSSSTSLHMFYFDLWPHRNNDKTYKVVVNISTKQARNIFWKLICKQNFIKYTQISSNLTCFTIFYLGISHNTSMRSTNQHVTGLTRLYHNNHVPQIGSVHRKKAHESSKNHRKITAFL